MKRIFAMLFALMICGSAWSQDRTAIMTDEACAVVYEVAESVAKDMIKDNSIDTLNLDGVFQIMFWMYYDELQNASGLRERQLVNGQVGVLWLRENNIMLRNTVKRVFNSNNADRKKVDVIGTAVADLIWNKCDMVDTYNISPLTMPNPKAPKIKM